MTKPGKLSRLIADPGSSSSLRGEIWVSPDVLAQAGLSRGPKGRVDLALSLGADICFFPWPGPAAVADLKERAELAHLAGLDCGLTIDGPFQRLASAGDILDVFLELGRDPSGFRRRLEQLSAAGIAAGWHSDGNVASILPDVVQCGFRFFALEPECVDLLSFKRTYGPRATLIGGIRTEWLTTEEPGPEQRARWRNEIDSLAGEGGLIVASCCGIHSPLFLSRLRRLYRLFDGEDPA